MESIRMTECIEEVESVKRIDSIEDIESIKDFKRNTLETSSRPKQSILLPNISPPDPQAPVPDPPHSQTHTLCILHSSTSPTIGAPSAPGVRTKFAFAEFRLPEHVGGYCWCRWGLDCFCLFTFLLRVYMYVLSSRLEARFLMSLLYVRVMLFSVFFVWDSGWWEGFCTPRSVLCLIACG